jgi:hypothetical protein
MSAQGWIKQIKITDIALTNFINYTIIVRMFYIYSTFAYIIFGCPR